MSTPLRMDGAKFFAKLPDGEQCVGIVTHRDCVYVATTSGLYRVQGDTLVRLRFAILPPEEDGRDPAA